MIQHENEKHGMQDPENDLTDKNAAARETQNWDEREILNRDTQRHRPQNERRNLQANQERRDGSGGAAMDPGRRPDRNNK